jgi:hypothetical protein
MSVTAAIGARLTTNGFAEISTQERYRAIQCIEHREAIEQWRAGLDDAHRRRLNHPAAVWANWKRATHQPAAERSFYIESMTMLDH